MREATLEAYAAAHEALRKDGRCLSGNIFLDAARVGALFCKKPCLLVEAAHSLFVLVPRHAFHDVLYLTTDATALPADVVAMLAAWTPEKPLRLSLPGREPEIGEVALAFEKTGFGLVKKLLRTKLEVPDERILAAMRPFAEEVRDLIGYARHGEEEEILEILRESFDTMGDNLPELEEIRERIDERGIAVVRKEGRIVALNYFAIQSGVFHSFYDVTRKAHRGGNGFFMALSVFVHDELKARGVSCGRSLGWRDATQKKLLRHARKSNQQPDGIVIYNMRWPGESPVPVCRG